MTPKNLFNTIITHTHKNTPEQIKFLIDNGFHIVYPTKRSIPKELRRNRNVKSVTDNLDGLTHGVIWSDELLIKSLDKHFEELKKSKLAKEVMALQMILVNRKQIKMVGDINYRLRSEMETINCEVTKRGFLGNIFHRKRFKEIEERHLTLRNYIWANGQFIKRLESSIIEMEYITKID